MQASGEVPRLCGVSLQISCETQQKGLELGSPAGQWQSCPLAESLPRCVCAGVWLRAAGGWLDGE